MKLSHFLSICVLSSLASASTNGESPKFLVDYQPPASLKPRYTKTSEEIRAEKIEMMKETPLIRLYVNPRHPERNRIYDQMIAEEKYDELLELIKSWEGKDMVENLDITMNEAKRRADLAIKERQRQEREERQRREREESIRREEEAKKREEESFCVIS